MEPGVGLGEVTKLSSEEGSVMHAYIEIIGRGATALGSVARYPDTPDLLLLSAWLYIALLFDYVQTFVIDLHG